MSGRTSWLDRAVGPDRTVLVTPESLLWVRWRLAANLHARSYHDAGVEVTPGPPGDELRRPYRIATPHCQQGHRVLGDLAWGGAWMAPAVTNPVRSWGEFRRRAFAAMGVASWRTQHHKGCFHRRGKARHDIVFEVAITLLGAAPSLDDSAVWALESGDSYGEGFTELLDAAGDALPIGGPARHLAVRCCTRPVAVLRSDGQAATRRGVVDLAALWWEGHGISALADAVAASADHEHD